MKTLIKLTAAAAALLALAACEPKTENVTSVTPDPMASEVANRAPVELPPAIESSVTMRCKDNSLVYLEFFKGAKQVQFKGEKAGPATMLMAPNAGEPYVAEGGFKVTGDAKVATVEAPGRGTLSCKAG